jgi:hypothetical protein
MLHYLAEGTPPARLDGTTTGIVVMIVVMLPALAFFIGLIYWSARPSAPGGAGQPQPAIGQSSAGAAERPVRSSAGHGAPPLLVEHVEHDEQVSGS